MFGVVNAKLAPVLAGLRSLLADHPVECALYFIPLTVLTLLLLRALWRLEGRQAYWLAAAIVVLNAIFSFGDDSYTHIYRIVALSEQFRHGELGMLLTNPTTGQLLPVFVFYSVLPYLAPTTLNLVGVPAVVAFKLAMVVQFLVMAAGLQALIDRTRDGSRPERRPDRRQNRGPAADWLVAILFLFANYVYALWCTRAALAELWVYSFIPWIVAGIAAEGARGGSVRSLTGLFFLQACGHPIVLAQSLMCELAAPLCLGTASLRQLVRRALVPLALAMILAAPFWLPQFLWKDLIMGPAGLPDELLRSFRTPFESVHPRDFRSIGPWLPLALVLVLAASRGRLSARLWLVGALWLAVMALQSTYLAALVARLPVLNLSVFIWRFMFPAAFLGFAVAVAGWRETGGGPVRILSAFAFLSVAAMLWLSLTVAPRSFVKLAEAGNDRAAFVGYDKGDGVWGIKEYLPDNARLAKVCPGLESDVQRIKYVELRKGLTAERPLVAIKDGPHGLVAYEADGVTLPPGACGADLVLSVKPGQRIVVREGRVDALFYVRMLDLLAVAAGIALFGRRGRRRSLIQG